jgi:undecaprenyl pyrophosphate phosphatase UppP
VLRLGYVVGALLVLVPAVEIASRAFPARTGHAAWRFGAAGIAYGQVATMLLGMFLAMAVAAVADHRRVLRGLAVLLLVGAALIVATLPVFAMDYAELRAGVDARAHAEMDRNTWKAAIVAGLVAVAAAWSGVVGWRAGRAERTRAATPPLVV